MDLTQCKSVEDYRDAAHFWQKKWKEESEKNSQPDTQPTDAAREAAELLPCPFCDEPPQTMSQHGGQRLTFVRCRHHVAWLTEAEWQTRALSTTAALRREVEELREKLNAVTRERDEAKGQLDNINNVLSLRGFQGVRNVDARVIQMALAYDTALARAEALKDSLRDLLPEWSTADWEYAEGENPRLIAGEYTFGDALALRAAIDATNGGSEG